MITFDEFLTGGLDNDLNESIVNLLKRFNIDFNY